jgi:hypothetical protein
MPRTEMVVRVFVASPSDVSDERTQLEDIIRELNLSFPRDLGARLELVRWETHVTPGVSVDAQAVINEAIDDEYDIFIGLLWARFGTPTGRAGSGTEEEFTRAYARYKRDPSAVRIMFYFKDAPIPPSQIDADQLAKVAAFRSELGELGVLYWNYTDRDAFGSFLRIHLARQIHDWAKRSDSPREISNSLVPAIQDGSVITITESDGDDDDAGLVELMEESEEGMERMTETLSRMMQELAHLTAKMDERTSDFNTLNTHPGGEFDRAQFKRISKQAAEDMIYYTRRSEADLPLYIDAMKVTFESLTRVASLFADLGPQHKDELKDALTNIRMMRKSAVQAGKAIAGFREIVASLPRVSTDMNRAKRRMVTAVDGIVDALNTTEGLIAEVEKVMWETLLEMPDEPLEMSDEPLAIPGELN